MKKVERLDEFRATVPAGHVIDTLMSEHDMILAFLDGLESANEAIQAMHEYDAEREVFATLRHVAEHLAAAHLHHVREEQVLFAELERRGVTEPTAMLTSEHRRIRSAEEKLKRLAGSTGTMLFEEFQGRLSGLVTLIVPVLRDHIHKENHVLYPTAMEVITDETAWDDMRRRCDEIGYCCFTPERN